LAYNEVHSPVSAFQLTISTFWAAIIVNWVKLA